MGGLYGITIYKQAETPENAILLCEETREILTKHEEHDIQTKPEPSVTEV